MKKLLTLVLSLCALLCSCSNVDIDDGEKRSEPIEAIMEAALDADGDAYLKQFPPQMKKDYDERQAIAVFFGVKSMSEWLSQQRELYKQSYGNGLQIDGEVEKIEELTVAEVEDMNPDPYTYISYVTKDNTEAVCAVTLSYELEGSKTKNEFTKVIIVVKQGGKWYVHPIHAFDTFG